jgi:hypothetical protein
MDGTLVVVRLGMVDMLMFKYGLKEHAFVHVSLLTCEFQTP